MTAHAMAAEAEFVTPPSTPPPDILEIVVERRLRQHDGGEGGGSSSTMTIFRVPAHVRDANRDLYEPRLVSIGPYYRGRPALRAMEQHKWRYLRELLALYPAASSADCVRAVRAVEHRARLCYSEQTDIFAATAGVQGENGHGRQSRQGDDTAAGGGGFAEMLLLDGCFVLQFFIKWHLREPDRLCDVGWGLPLLLSDLLLMENQIPFFVLEALFLALTPEATKLGLLTLIVQVFKLDDSAFYRQVLHEQEVPARAHEIHHLLHLYYEAFVPSADELAVASASPAQPPSPTEYEVRLPQNQMGGLLKMAGVPETFVLVPYTPRVPGWMKRSASMSLLTLLCKVSAWFGKLLAPVIGATVTAAAAAVAPTETDHSSTQTAPPMVVPSVTLLRDAGVGFEKAPSARHMFDVAFDAARGVLRMPAVAVDYATKAQLVNLVAFEQTTPPAAAAAAAAGGRLLSSYAALVGSLVRTGADVEHLQKRGIVDNLLPSSGDGDGDAAARFFQQLGDCSSLDYEDHHFAAMFAELSRYYHSSWRRHKAKFLRDHCSSPWAVLALVVAGCAFCFALVKFSTTIYGLAHPYCRHC